MSNSKNN